MTDPERRYQRWLRLYPKEYRSVRGDEMLATLLDSTEHDHPKIVDLLHIIVHAARVRLSVVGKGPVRRPLPQPVRLATWILVGLAVVNWANAILNAALDHSHPKEPSMQPWVIVTGFVLLGLNLLLQARRRLLYMIVIAVLVAFIATGLMATGLSGAALVIEVPYLLLVLLLAAGWRRYMAAISSKETPAGATRGTRLV